MKTGARRRLIMIIAAALLLGSVFSASRLAVSMNENCFAGRSALTGAYTGAALPEVVHRTGSYSIHPAALAAAGTGSARGFLYSGLKAPALMDHQVSMAVPWTLSGMSFPEVLLSSETMTHSFIISFIILSHIPDHAL